MDNHAYTCTLKDRAGVALPSGSSPTIHFARPWQVHGHPNFKLSLLSTWTSLSLHLHVDLQGFFLCVFCLEYCFSSLMLPSRHLDLSLAFISSERTSQETISNIAPSAATPRHSPWPPPLPWSSSICSLLSKPPLSWEFLEGRSPLFP